MTYYSQYLPSNQPDSCHSDSETRTHHIFALSASSPGYPYSCYSYGKARYYCNSLVIICRHFIGITFSALR